MTGAALWRFVARRLAAAVLLAVGATLVSFLLTQVVPGDPISANLSEQALENPEAVAAFEERYGLDQPLPVQYGRYLTNVLQGDLGESQQSRRPVTEDLADFVPATMELALTAIVIAVLLGVAFGTIAAVRAGRSIDQFLRVVSLLGLSMPPFWLALVAVYLFNFELGLVPSSGRLDPVLIPPETVTGAMTVDAVLDGDWEAFRSALHHLVLPASVLAAFAVGLFTRFTRSSVLEVIEQDYIRAAWAKGLHGRRVVIGHVLRAALVPVITVASLAFGSMLSGTVLIESIFSWPGVGSYAFRSALNLDVPAIMGVSLFVALVYVTINFVVDVLYGVIDPRIRIE
ncbi:ABC transporter permease [Egibacter rhizosphaerae]|uniref:ABC transporter permease n=1 Tax=Egibacter rhizosphaerae TaxID=1670831 RepID=A0A411YF58_9ACTN|nr:ABC transporter permease [Egibacter rhizosphaerae]QBI19858.1 ABC transporter permease [Egibacter rhizosphaerae]